MPACFLRLSCCLAAGAWVLVGAAMLCAAEPEVRYTGELLDGTRLEGKQLTAWHSSTSKPRLDKREFLNEELVWLRDDSLTLSRPTESYIEFFGGDRMPGSVESYLSPSWSSYDRHAPCLAVATQVDWQRPGIPAHEHVRISTPWVKRIVWESDTARAYQPGTAFYRDGRQARFRSLRFVRYGVRLLLESGTDDIPFTRLAELHLPERDAWDCYYEQLALLTPGCVSRLMRVETIEGLTATTSLERFRITSPGGHDPHHWLHMVQPAWSLDPLWLRHSTIRLRQYSDPHEVPLSMIELPPAVQVSESGDRWNCQLNANARGGPLRCEGWGYGWGIGMHAWCELRIPLPPSVRSFRTSFGLDDVAGRGGCARAEVLAGVPNQWERLFQSEHLVGSGTVVDTGDLELPSPPSADERETSLPRQLVLRADPAHEGRPAGADPLNIRDTLDWLQPRVTFAPDRLESHVALRYRQAVPAWRGWRVDATGAVPIAFENYWEALDPRREGYRMLVCPRVPWLILSRSVEPSPNYKYLAMAVSRPQKTHPAQIMVRLNGAEAAQFEVPIRHNAADPEPLVVPLPPAEAGTVDVEIVLLPLGPEAMLDWQSISLVPELPARRMLLDEEPIPAAAQVGEGELPKAFKLVALNGETAWGIEGKDPSRSRWEFAPIEIEEYPRLGAYRYLCFGWQGSAARICLELGHDGQWGPPERTRDPQSRSFRYDAGTGKPSYDAARRLGPVPPVWSMTVRDLYSDFGEFKLTGLGIGTPDGGSAQFDVIFLARSRDEIEKFHKQMQESR